MSGPSNKDGPPGPGGVRRGRPAHAGSPGETSGDFGLDRAIQKLQAELEAEPVAGPSAVDVLDAPGAGAVVRPGSTGRVVGAPPVPSESPVGAQSDPGLRASDSGAATRRDLSAAASGLRDAAAPGDARSDSSIPPSRRIDSPVPALPPDRPGVQGPAYTDSGLHRTASASSSWRPPKASESSALLAAPPPPTPAPAPAQSAASTASGAAWRPVGASDSATAAFGRVASQPAGAAPHVGSRSPAARAPAGSHAHGRPDTDVSRGGADPKTEPMAPLPRQAAPSSSAAMPAAQSATAASAVWSAERTAVGRSPAPRYPQPRPLWLVFVVIAGIVAGAVAVVMLARTL